MDNSQNAQQKTNPGDTPDETSDTGFNETLAHNAVAPIIPKIQL